MQTRVKRGTTWFRSSGYLEDSRVEGRSGHAFSIRELPAFLRTLLVADGTVTKSLEAWFWEPVEVQPLRQELLALPERIEGLVSRPGDEVLRREVCLAGKQSGKQYACARSWLALDELPGELAGAMVSGKIGIGELLREQGVETYREIIGLDYIPDKGNDDPLPVRFGSDLVSRAYRIRVGGVPAILVTEYFPVDAYR